MALTRFTTALLLLLVPISPVLAGSKSNDLAPQAIHDLRYGETLYHFFQKKYFSAITDLMVANSINPISTQGEDPKLLLGGLYLAYGMQDAAGKLFKQILKNDKMPSTHDRVWYYIGKMRYQDGDFEGAKRALLRIKGHLPTDREAESLQILANIYMREKDYKKAIALLRDFHGNSDWEAYAKYNLGVALVKAGQMQQGTQLLLDVGELKTDKINHEIYALRDRANLALGFAHLRGKDPADAVKDFQRIRLVGPMSNKALLGLGWAYTKLKQYNKALIPWFTLQQRNHLNTAVQESLIAIPYVMEKLGKKRLAMSYYNKAINAYSSEIKHLGDVMAAVQHGELLRAMQPANIDDETSLPLNSFGLPNSISTPYLHNMMATNRFQGAYRNLQNLVYLRYVLQHWEAQLPSYRLILSERRKTYFDKLPHIASDKKLEQITKMTAERDKLAAKLKHIEQTQDGLGLVTADEEHQLKTLSKIKHSLELLSNSQNLSKAREEYRLMQGVLYFRSQSEFIPRLWQSKRDLHKLDQALARVRKTKRNLIKAANDAPKYFQGYSEKINNDRQRIDDLLGRLDIAIQQARTKIQHMAMRTLIQRRQQLQNYHIRARFGIARLYDSLVIEKEKHKGGKHDQK